MNQYGITFNIDYDLLLKLSGDIAHFNNCVDEAFKDKGFDRIEFGFYVINGDQIKIILAFEKILNNIIGLKSVIKDPKFFRIEEMQSLNPLVESIK